MLLLLSASHKKSPTHNPYNPCHAVLMLRPSMLSSWVTSPVVLNISRELRISKCRSVCGRQRGARTGQGLMVSSSLTHLSISGVCVWSAFTWHAVVVLLWSFLDSSLPSRTSLSSREQAHRGASTVVDAMAGTRTRQRSREEEGESEKLGLWEGDGDSG